MAVSDVSPTPSMADGAALVDLVRRFAQDEVAPRVTAYDRDEHLPADILNRMGALGLILWVARCRRHSAAPAWITCSSRD